MERVWTEQVLSVVVNTALLITLHLHSRLWTMLTTSQDLKDFARNSGQLDVVYSETGRDRDGKGFVLLVTLRVSTCAHPRLGS